MDELKRLGTRDRAFAVAAVRALGLRAEAVCARRSPALRPFAAQLARSATRLANEATRLGHAIPDGIADVDPSWYDAPRASTRPAAAAWLQRRAFGRLVEMVRVEADPSDPADAIERRSGARIGELLVALGRRRVAVAFSGAPRGALAQLCARLGEPAGSELVAEVRQIAAHVIPADVTSAQQALHAGRPDDGGGEHDSDGARLFLRVGVAWLAPALAERGGDRLPRIAQRLPRSLGEALLQAAGGPVDDAVLATAAALVAQPRLRAV
jgi:hypothetical protein